MCGGWVVGKVTELQRILHNDFVFTLLVKIPKRHDEWIVTGHGMNADGDEKITLMTVAVASCECNVMRMSWIINLVVK